MNGRKCLAPVAAGIFGAWVSLVALDNLASQASAGGKNVPAGFTPLFNGKDLTGWKIHGGNIKAWGVEKGLLYVAQPARQKPGGKEQPFWLMTEKEYGDFELRLEFKVPEGG